MAKVCETALRATLVCIIVVGSAAHDLHLPTPSRPTINHGRLEPLHCHREPAPTPTPEPKPSNPTLNIVQHSQEPVPGPNPTYVDHPPLEPVAGPVPGEVTDPPPGEPVPGPNPTYVDHPPLEPVPGPNPTIVDHPPFPSLGPMPPVARNHLSSSSGSFYSRPYAAGAPTHA